MSDWTTRPLHRSLDALAQLAVRETGACGYAYVEDAKGGGSKQLSGNVVFESARGPNADLAVARYSIATDTANSASVAFGFRGEQDARAAQSRLEAIVKAIQTLWQMTTADAYADLVQRVAALELEVIDSKIADRAKGLLISAPIADPAEAMVKHILNVTRASSAQKALQAALTSLEEELEERKLVSQAKQILQRSQGLSEEQAHTELRRASRQARTRLRDVAMRIIVEKS